MSSPVERRFGRATFGGSTEERGEGEAKVVRKANVPARRVWCTSHGRPPTSIGARRAPRRYRLGLFGYRQDNTVISAGASPKHPSSPLRGDPRRGLLGQLVAGDVKAGVEGLGQVDLCGIDRAVGAGGVEVDGEYARGES